MLRPTDSLISLFISFVFDIKIQSWIIVEYTFDLIKANTMTLAFFKIAIVPIKTQNVHFSTGNVKTNVRTK